MNFEEKSNTDLYRIIREGTVEESELAIGELQKREAQIRANSLRGAAVAIAARNNSHGIGAIAKTVTQKRAQKRRSKKTVKKQ